MVRMHVKKILPKITMSILPFMLLIVLFVCLNTGIADAQNLGKGSAGSNKDSTTDTSQGTSDSGSKEGTAASGDTADNKFEVSVEAVRLTATSGTIILSSKGGDAAMYYLLPREADKNSPSADDIIKEGYKSQDGFVSIPPLAENVEYLFYVVAVDGAGNRSNVVSKRGVSSASRSIDIDGHIYLTMQVRDEIDGYTNEPGVITINPGTDNSIKKIEYIIADTFVNSPGLIESVAVETQDVATSAGPSSLTVSKWAEYDPNEKPGLIRNMLNYVYVRMTDTDDNITYISSHGIWEDETQPMALSVTAEAGETTAVVTVTGDDDESGVKKYYFLFRDPIDISPVEAEDVKKKGMASDDGIFELSGLLKRTRYELYAVVEDMAGNLSTVRIGEMTTEGEATASAIRPGGDTSSNPGTTSNVDKRTDGVTLEDPDVIETVPERTPYLVSSDNRDYSDIVKIAGWDNIKTIVSKSAEPADIYVNMNGGVVVPGDVLKEIFGRDITYHFIMDDVFVWVVNGKGFSSTPMSTDLRVSHGTSHIPSKLVNELAGVYPREEFSIEHEGAFGFTALLDMKLGSENEGKNAHLYYYNEQDYRLEHLQTVKINDRGQASFTIPDKTDYLVIMGPVTETEEPVITTEEPTEAEEKKADEFINTPNKSSALWIIIVSVIAVMLFIIILFVPRDKSSDEKMTDA